MEIMEKENKLDDSVQGDLHFTRARVVRLIGDYIPQIHLTLISVLQSAALAFLLKTLGDKPPHGFDFTLIKAIIINNFYLFHLTSFLLIIIAWNQFVYATIFLHWPLNFWTNALQFIFATVEIAAYTSIENIGLWFFWIGLTMVVGSIIRHRNRRATDINLYPNSSVRDLEEKRISPKNLQLVILSLGGTICSFIGILRSWGYLHLFITAGGYILNISDDLIALLLLGIGVFLIKADDKFYISMLREFFKERPSLYGISNNGKITALVKEDPGDTIKRLKK